MTRREQALKLCELLNAGTDVYEALEQVDLGEEDTSVEEGLSLEDPDNDIIDLLWRDGELYLLRRNGRRGRKTPWRVELITEVN
jgi:hypothetical protein